MRLAAARASARAKRLERESSRRAVEDLRFQAGLARVAAQRFDGAQIAAGTFQEAHGREQEGETLYRQGDFDAARGAFQDAARLYHEAESISHEERVRRVSSPRAVGFPVSRSLLPLGFRLRSGERPGLLKR